MVVFVGDEGYIVKWGCLDKGVGECFLVSVFGYVWYVCFLDYFYGESKKMYLCVYLVYRVNVS